MAYSKTNWVNDTTPAISAANLNKIENGIDAASSASSISAADIEKLANGLSGYVSTNDYESHAEYRWGSGGSLISAAHMTAVKVKVTGRKTLSLTGYDINHNSTYAIRWVSYTGTITSSTDYTTADEVVDYIVTVPSDAEYLLITYRNDQTLAFKVKVFEVITSAKSYTDSLVGGIEDEISLVENQNYVSDYGWRNAGISAVDGSETPRNDRICTDYLTNVSSFRAKNGYYGAVAYFSKNKTWLGSTTLTKNVYVAQDSFPANTYYVRAIMGKGDSIDVSEGVNCDIRFSSQGIQNLQNQIDDTRSVSDTAFSNTKVELVKKTIKFVSREGLFHVPGTLNILPYNNLVAIQNAYNYGYDSIRIDVRWTTDNVPVIHHDDAINNVAKNPDGTAISETVNISEHTLAELNEYDFGIRYGAQYAGMEITQLEDALKLCKELGMECCLEIKPETVTENNFNSLVAPIIKYSMKNNVYVRSHTQSFLTYVNTNAPGLSIEVSSSITLSEANQLLDVDYAISVKNVFNKVRLGFAYTAGTTTFYDSVIKKAQLNGIDIIIATVYNEEDMLDVAVSEISVIEVAYVTDPYKVFIDSLESE